jgi:pyruvyl transferase EpsO
VDWPDCITTRDRVAFALLFRTIRYANRAGIPLHPYRAWYDLRDSIVRSGVRLISRSQVVHTNRLHAMLLALFLDREVVAFDNSNGKLSAYRRSWLMGIPSLQFVET